MVNKRGKKRKEEEEPSQVVVPTTGPGMKATNGKDKSRGWQPGKQGQRNRRERTPKAVVTSTR